MIKVNIQILNDNGDELLDKRVMYTTLEELGIDDTLVQRISEEAKANELVDGEFLVTDDEMVFGGSMVRALDNGLQTEDLKNY